MTGYTVMGDVDERAVQQLARCAESGDAFGAALCADGHVGYSQPIGGVVAYRDRISPSGVGYDIGCGNKAVKTNIHVTDIFGCGDRGSQLGTGQSSEGAGKAGDATPTRPEVSPMETGVGGGAPDQSRSKNEASLHAYPDRRIAAIMDEIAARISFGMGRNNDEPVDHPVLERIANAPFEPQRKLAQLAANQLGTVGSGNHYVDLFEDEGGWVWVGVHFGSRGFGHKTASGFLALAQGQPFDGKATEGEMDSPPVLFDTTSGLGQSYIEAMQLAGEYAYAGRDVVLEKVLEILGAQAVEGVHNHHNFAWRETHGASVCGECDGHGEVFRGELEIDRYVEGVRLCPECAGDGRVGGEDVWVVRKGCTPAWPGQKGFVGATMGEPSVILEGVEHPDSAGLLYSTVHGAGRVMSRTQAAGKIKRRKYWECSERDCAYTSDDGAKPCPEHGHARMLKRWRTERVRPGLIDFDEVQQTLQERGIELRGGAADEAPGAYKRLADVLWHHRDTVRVLHTLKPVGVAMAGADMFDPYKD